MREGGVHLRHAWLVFGVKLCACLLAIMYSCLLSLHNVSTTLMDALPIPLLTQQYGVNIAGVIVNKVRPEKFDQVSHM